MTTLAHSNIPIHQTDPAMTIRGGFDRLIPIGIIVWLTYNVTGYRLPWQQIIVSDGDSGAKLRQLTFALVGLIALRRLLITGSLNRVLGYHFRAIAIPALMFCTLAYSTNPTLTFKRTVIFLLGLITLMAAVHITRTPVRLMQRTLFWTAAMTAFISLIGHVLLPADCTSIAERPGLAGVSSHPNTLAPVLVVGIVISLGMAWAKGKERILILAFTTIMIVAIILSNSITAISCLLCSYAIYQVLVSNRYRQGAIQITVVVVVVVISIVGMETIKLMLFDIAGRDPSLSGRDELWISVFHEGLKNPIFGQGYGAFWYEGRGREIVGTWNPRQSHNAYVDVFVDLGIVGTTFIILSIFGPIWYGWNRCRHRHNPLEIRAVSSIVALATSFGLVYAFGESFLLKMDKFPFFALLWCSLLLGNQSSNEIGKEFQATNLSLE